MNKNDYDNILCERYEDGFADGREEGREEGVRIVASKMKERGIDPTVIADVTGLPVDVCRSL
jgi:hypothetical protein